MKKIYYPLKFYIVDLTLDVFILMMCIIALRVLAGSGTILAMVAYGLFLLMSLFDLTATVWNIQWIEIDKGTLCVRNIFGLVKELELSKIKTVKITNARAFGLKMYSKYFSCIVISHRKSLRVCDVKDAYNHKKSPYVIFPNTDRNRRLIKTAYLAVTDNELTIS
jgi:hypothetical protein